MTDEPTTTSTTDAAPDPGNDGKDYTLDAAQLKQGQLAYLYGYKPIILFTDEGDGTVEVYELGDQRFYPAGDISTHRGPRPSSLAPEAPQSGDRIAALETQVATLLELLKAQGVATTPAPAAVAAPGDAGDTPTEQPSGGDSPFTTG